MENNLIGPKILSIFLFWGCRNDVLVFVIKMSEVTWYVRDSINQLLVEVVMDSSNC